MTRGARAVLGYAVLVVLSAGLLGCASVRPVWTTQPPAGYRNDFIVGTGSASDQATARRLAVQLDTPP